MFIDTIMVLWTRIWYGKLKSVFVTSFLVGISLLLLLIMVGVPLFSHLASTTKHRIRSVDVATKREYALSTQPHLDGLSTLPFTPTTLVTPTALVMPPQSIASSEQQDQMKRASEAPTLTIVIIVPKHIPAVSNFRASAKHQAGPIIKKGIQPTATSVSSQAPTRVIATAVVSTPTPALSPVHIRTAIPTPLGSHTPTPDASPAPTITGTVQANPTLLPAITKTPTSTDLSWMDF